LAVIERIKMKKWIALAVLAGALFASDALLHEELRLHEAFPYLVLFFVVQTIVLFRMDDKAKEEWKVQVSLIKVVVRLLSALVFVLVIFQTYDDHFSLVIQFFALYLAFMTFEIIMSLANLRRN